MDVVVRPLRRACMLLMEIDQQGHRLAKKVLAGHGPVVREDEAKLGVPFAGGSSAR